MGTIPIITATSDYEQWLRSRLDVVEADLQLKHREMSNSPFTFLRGSFYRWVSLWREVCPDLTEAPEVLGVGDLHVENFGSWRDSEGRLVWGVNDFDEVAKMPYALDLVRLVTSVILANRESRLSIGAGDAAAAVLEGYSQSLESGGSAFILEENHPSLRAMALSVERDPSHFWSKLNQLQLMTPSKDIQRLLVRFLPDKPTDIRFAHRIAGVGSLGRPRFVAIGSCNDGLVAREAKAWLPSAWGWSTGRPKDRVYSTRLLKKSVRQPDPYYVVQDGWVIRRLGPYYGRIELAQFPKRRDEKLILRDMGHETANLHLATAQRKKVLRDLSSRRPDWLLRSAQLMSEATQRDWKIFRSSSL